MINLQDWIRYFEILKNHILSASKHDLRHSLTNTIDHNKNLDADFDDLYMIDLQDLYF